MAKEVANDWTIRRRVVISILTFCGTLMAYIVITEGDAAMFGSLSILMTTTAGWYIMGATWDDKK